MSTIDKNTAEEMVENDEANGIEANVIETNVEGDENESLVNKEKPMTKRKKRKVRKKQKNIRKDNRTTSEKPDHLQNGNGFYGGRPLTKETREFLKMPQSRTLTLKQQKEKYGDKEKEAWDATESGLGIDDIIAHDALNESTDNRGQWCHY